MEWDAWLALGVAGGVAVALACTRIAADVLLVAALTALIVTGVLPVEEALAGFANPGLATVAVLYVVASGLVETGAVNYLGEYLLGRPRSARSAQLRLMLPVVSLSTFLNNTPVVAMLVPAVQAWARRNQLPVSQLMLPLSYAAILGGTCSIIGTSTNLVVAGLATARTSLAPIGFFEVAWLGVPTAIVGVTFVVALGRWLLPDRGSPVGTPADPREYALELLVAKDSPLIGRTIEAAGLRHLSGVYLAEIERAGSVLPAVPPTERLRAGDRLVFVGMVESVLDLYKIRGLVPAPDQVFKLDSPRPERQLIEAVLAPTSPVVGRTIREAEFRSQYEAVVIAVAREGRRVPGKLGDIQLLPGDTLLLEARPSFVRQQRGSRDFLLVSPIEGAHPPRHDRAWIAGLVLLALVIGVALLGLPMLHAALLAAAASLALRCTTAASARRSVDWSVLIVIACALGLGRALESTGAAQLVASAWVDMVGQQPWLALLAVYAITSVATELITNNAAAVLIFPIAEATAVQLGIDLRPFVFVVMLAASASFATPLGYQTNLIVYGPGGYKYADYLRIGIPMNFLCGIVAVAIAPWIWPF